MDFIVPGGDASQLSILRVDQTEYVRPPALIIIPGHGASSQSTGALPSITSLSPPFFLSASAHLQGTTLPVC